MLRFNYYFFDIYLYINIIELGTFPLNNASKTYKVNKQMGCNTNK